ncbi:MAG: nucleotide exchange factor GrpE [Gammaproteobacteria bacterium]|nr:nucleotide exchange factor GrpE [Gammaproteobacteria bacterium]MDH3370936.1 nucleotide exchange factor GrpE [Gammaproteobacteria bacterium]MDH3406323.1 nucleotide exchange factor GrpE [Gammaproteobacteria bacterium]
MSQHKEAPTDPAAEDSATPGPEADSSPNPEARAPHDLEPATEIQQLQAELEKARMEATENLDRFLRAKAEAENMRKRGEMDMAATRKYAIERFASEIVSVRDSLELARMVELPQDSHPAVQKMREGLDLTLKLMESVFQKFGLILVDPQGQKFDPEHHQAISMVDSNEVPPNHVVSVVQKGLLLNDRLLRPAMVVVARGASEPENPDKKA